MSTFDDLEKKAKAQVAEDKTATVSWVKAHRAWLIAIGIALVTGIILAKACSGS